MSAVKTAPVIGGDRSTRDTFGKKIEISLV